jgi:recombination DNA repair RAD52 pathway protein
MKRALRMFGNRLGNCAYDKVFLKEIKNVRNPSCLGAVTPFRPANYPKQPSVEAVAVKLETEQTVVNAQIITTTNIATSTKPGCPTAPLTKSPLTTSPPLIPVTVAAAAVAYDESLFDNSMMISEEDLISDDNFNAMEFEDDVDVNVNVNVYPILPNKRK